jgi:hypothetical protein
MAIGRDMAWYKYTPSDGGPSFNVKIRKDIGDMTAATGFLAYDTTLRNRPVGFKLRGVRVLHAASGATRFVPIGSETATLWTGAANSLTLMVEGDADGETYAVTRKVSEDPGQVAHVVRNI